MTKLTTGRIADSFTPLLTQIGSPAVAPQPRGKSSGSPTGKPRMLQIRYPIAKKGFAKPKKP